jgi:CheY-like chemotaxis protein
MHGGTIEGFSEGHATGATFIVKLPMMLGLLDSPSESSSSRRAAAAGARLSASDLRDVRVLVVDDDRDSLLMVRDILEAAGASVTTAASVDAALQELPRARPDVLLSDIEMPVVDGFELITRIRQHAEPSVRAIPAAALTGYARSDDRTTALRAGFQLHLAKPINPNELIESVRALHRARSGGQ